MATDWTKPEYSRERVNKAGQALLEEGPLSLDDALEILNNWRSAHSFPLNTIAMDMRSKVNRINARPVYGTRLKRAASIRRKLERIAKMKLSRMQDLGGCRAVLKTQTDVERVQDLYDRSRAAHQLIRTDDYIISPQETGYRGVHYVYKFQSPRQPEFQNLSIEVQIRSKIQHAWSTAVETVGAMRQEDLKGGRGDADWLRFFALASGAFARLEHTPLPPAIQEDEFELCKELNALAEQLDVFQELNRFRATLRVTENPGAKKADYFLLFRDPGQDSLRILGYRESEIRRAAQEYLRQETQPSLFAAESPEGGAVLVSASSLAQLRRAYPNYFSDTELFLKKLQGFVTSGDSRLG